jgi:hypothetical protein
MIRACLVMPIGLLAACGGSNSNNQIDAKVADSSGSAVDAKVFLDAPPDAPPVYDFSCLNVAPPTTAADPVSISGLAQEVSLNGVTPSIAPYAGNTLAACKGACTPAANRLGQTTTDNAGVFSLANLASNNVPVDGYVKAVKTGDRTTLVFPYSPIVGDVVNVPVLVFTTTAFSGVSAFFSATQNDTTNGVLGLAVVDCANTPITDTGNVTLIVKQNGVAVTGTTTADLGTVAAQAKGTFLIFNVPANATTEVNASYMGTTLTTFRAHNVRVEAGATTATLLRPGYSP